MVTAAPGTKEKEAVLSHVVIRVYSAVAVPTMASFGDVYKMGAKVV